MFYQPYSIIGFHSCDKEVGLRVLNGETDLRSSDNKWDWLADGIYFWEQNPIRAWEYAVECSENKQKNAKKIETPFVLGAIIEVKNCLNLVDANSLKILNQAYDGLAKVMRQAGLPLPENKSNNRALDRALIQYIHQANIEEDQPAYDTVRCAFPEGGPAFPGSHISERLHIQICVRNQDCIKGYFLPRPLKEFNPNL
ncbi:MAG: hypothetical protein JST70_14030 [Bacteroidetes bacterium]|nr:hypothetical protein [Bacteroidota bacterium]